MAIQNRRGVYSDFTPSKMVPGELAVVQSGDPNNTSGKAVYAAFGSSGDVKRLASEDDLSKKVDKETGKGLSTNDYTTEEKNKLNGIEAQANKTVIDATLTQQGKAADAKAVGDALNAVTIETDKTLSVTDAPADAKVVGDELADLKSDLSDKAPAITNTASGSIAHFEDGSDANAKSVIAHIEPVQDLHGYDNPWPAGGGKNICPPFEKGVSINSTTGAIGSSSVNATTGKIPVNFTQNPSYYISGLLDTLRTFVAAYNASDEFLGRTDATNVTARSINITSFPNGTPSGTGDIAYVRVTIYEYEEGTGVIDDIDNMTAQMEVGTSASSYEPYSNICPISGFTGMNVVRTGKNLLPNLAPDSIVKSGVTATKNSDGSITLNGTATSNNSFPIYGSNSENLKHFDFSTQVITLSGCPAGGSSSTYRLGGYLYKDGVYTGRTFISTGNPVTVSGVDYNQLYIIIFIYSGVTYNNLTFYPMIEIGSVASDYEPYQGETYPITFPSEAGTVYGGYVDPVKGKLVVDHVSLKLGNWMKGLIATYSGKNGYYYNGNSFNPPMASGRFYTDPKTKCTHFAKKNSLDNGMGIVVGVDSTIVYFPHMTDNIPDIETPAKFCEWLEANNVYMTYPLATPITYDITPQQIELLIGVNNVWNDCNGDTDVEYRADTKLYIEQLTKPTEDDMTANGNIANATFFMIGNRLFLSTASIAIGETIVPGTNCTELSLADALNNLNA